MKQNHTGIIALMTVLLMGAILLLVTIGISLRSRISGNMTIDQQLSAESMRLATSCMEYALLQLSTDTDYAGDETLTVGTESCIIEPVETPADQMRTVKTSGTVDGFVQRIKVEITDVRSPMVIGSWEKVGSF